jgi:hypothetical protein
MTDSCPTPPGPISTALCPVGYCKLKLKHREVYELMGYVFLFGTDRMKISFLQSMKVWVFEENLFFVTVTYWYFLRLFLVLIDIVVLFNNPFISDYINANKEVLILGMASFLSAQLL